MDIIFSASIIAAFLAGMVALFAPCCITVLLPAYLASAFKEKKNILRMTFIFFAGISVVLVPIGLGAGWLAEFFRDFHLEMYLVGGLLMIALSVMAFASRGLSMVPMPKRHISGDVSSPKSVFLIGIFSGAATSCCAPVLAGAVALSVISGAFWKAIVVVFAYVFGMILPLFIAAFFYDKFRIEDSKIIKGRMFGINFGGKKFFIHSTNIIAGIIFLAVGALLVFLALSGNAFWAPSFQVGIGEALNEWSQRLFDLIRVIPEYIFGSLVVILFAFLLYFVLSENKKP